MRAAGPGDIICPQIWLSAHLKREPKLCVICDLKCFVYSVLLCCPAGRDALSDCASFVGQSVVISWARTYRGICSWWTRCRRFLDRARPYYEHRMAA